MAVIEQRGQTMQRDRRDGITIVRKRLVDTEAETLSAFAGETVMGLPEESRTSHQLETGRHELLITYKGISIEETPINKRRWSGKLSMREEPLETFPRLPQLMKKFEGTFDDNGKVKFPDVLSGSNSGGFGGGTGSGKKNPMSGARTWQSIEGEITCNYISKVWPTDFYSQINAVRLTLPNSGIRRPKGYVFVTLLPEFDHYGEAWEITRKYKLVREDGYLRWLAETLA